MQYASALFSIVFIAVCARRHESIVFFSVGEISIQLHATDVVCIQATNYRIACVWANYRIACLRLA